MIQGGFVTTGLILPRKGQSRKLALQAAFYLLPVLLAGCATYQAAPLASKTSLLDSVPHLVVDTASLHFPAGTLMPHTFDASDGLDMTELAMLAVANNPDLQAARDDAGIAQAQAYAAGLLPDPQLALNHDLSNTGGPGATKAFSYGLSYDFGALVSRAATSSAADQEKRKTDLTVLWQEWQVISQARLLYIKLSIRQQGACHPGAKPQPCLPTACSVPRRRWTRACWPAMR